MTADAEPPLILYDGVCGLCNRFVQYVLRRDHAAIFRFAALQGELAGTILRRHGRDTAAFGSVIVVLERGTPDERLLDKSRAALYVLGQLGGVGSFARPLGLLPTRLLDVGYDLVAKNRYRVFGRNESCALPSAEQRARFVDLAN